MCRDINNYLKPAHCYVHPGTHLQRSTSQHVRHFHGLREKTLLLIHIGTNDIANGATPTVFLRRMQTLLKTISEVNQQVIYFAISAILPRMTDDGATKSTIKQCNNMMKHWTSQTNNIVFLNTSKLFLRNGKIVRCFYRHDGLHLNQQGKTKLFAYFQHFLWNFCHFKTSPHLS